VKWSANICHEEGAAGGTQMSLDNAKSNVSQLYRWGSFKTLLLAVCGITVVISLFEIKLDALAMLREVVSNFITCFCITFVAATMEVAFGLFRPWRSVWQTALLVFMLAVAGVIGGLLAWGINYLLFSVHMSHPHIYLIVVASLSIIFGLAITAYETICVRLEETAAKLAEKEMQAQRLHHLKTEAELEALRARVNPHFLFNTLNSVASLIPVEPAKAEELVQRMSNLFRYILSAGDRGLVPLSEELDIVEEYLAIEKVRLQGRLDYSVEAEPSLNGVMIPVMLLQPLVENSVKHGITPKGGGGSVNVDCRRNGGRCVITISDTGGGFDVEEPRHGFGLSGVKQRLELNYPGGHEFDITSGDGVTVRITIPAGK
jgi:sensor histidine kinase YesM